jgi:Lrp/AsnC family transcriptional regulator for asnA, asnC and gidA
MADLTVMDEKILKDLLIDGRKSFTQIAIECGQNKATIFRRFRELEKSGVIVGATLQVNYKKLKYAGIATTLISVLPNELLNTLDNISKIPEVGSYCYQLFGSTYNIQILSLLKDIRDLNRIRQLIYKQNEIITSQTYLWIDVRNTPANMFNDFARKEPQFSYKSPVISQAITEIDDIDHKIIELLGNDGRLPFYEISRRIGVSTQTVAKRYRNLKENNIVKSVIQTNYAMFGFEAWVEFAITLTDPNTINSVADAFTNLPRVVLVAKLSGNFDLAVDALLKSFKEFYELNNRILQIPGVKSAQAAISDVYQGGEVAYPTKNFIHSTF